MTKYKAIVSDFDGTLVDHTHRLTTKAQEAITEFIRSGKIFSIATGRGYPGALEKVCKELNMIHPVIVRGGSEIIDPQTGEVIWAKYINPETLKRLIDYLLLKTTLFFAAERGDSVYSKGGVADLEFGEGAIFKDIKNMELDTVPKVVVPPLNSLEQIEPLLEELVNLFPDLHIVKITSRKGVGLDINDGGAGKHIALLTYAKLMQIDAKEIIGVGDSYNDYPLLTACGYKVAMGNAPQELKDIADLIVKNQESDGIIEVLDLNK